MSHEILHELPDIGSPFDIGAAFENVPAPKLSDHRDYLIEQDLSHRRSAR
jgi:hypothetical protein